MRYHYNRRRAKELSDRGRCMARARWAADRARRDAEEPARIRALEIIAIENLPRHQGDPVGCLQWTCFRTGRVRRWVVRIGDRADRRTLEAPGGPPTASHGWTWIMEKLRSHLSRA
jgi:hypothetical protein